MKLGFYPGCSLDGTSKEYNESVKALAPVFDNGVFVSKFSG